MYDFRYINRNQQKDSVSYTLLVEDIDNDDIIGNYRIDLVFKCDPNVIDEEFLRSQARKEIERIIKEVAEEALNGDISE